MDDQADGSIAIYQWWADLSIVEPKEENGSD